MDLSKNRYENFETLENYCHRVASVVGLLSIEIFGYKNPATRDYAIYLGKALQLTNILRDVKTDAARGRIYLPLDELKKFNVGENEILQFKYSKNFHALASNVAARAENFYQLARKTLAAEDRNSMIAAELMGAVYWQLLKKLERQQFNVFGGQPVRINRPQKLLLIFRSWLRFTFGATTSNYGTP
jgi:phytoene synthase